MLIMCLPLLTHGSSVALPVCSMGRTDCCKSTIGLFARRLCRKAESRTADVRDQL